MKWMISREGGISFLNEDGMTVGMNCAPVKIELWDGVEGHSPVQMEKAYDNWQQTDGMLIGRALLQSSGFGKFELTDKYRMEGAAVVLERKLKIAEGEPGKGIRLWWDMALYPQEGLSFADLRYFAPPAVFDKNDLDEDGYEDYFHTQKLMHREDRFNYPMFMAYDEKRSTAVRLERYRLPQYDSIPERAIGKNGEKTAVFLQKTDIGSLGVIGEEGKPTRMCGCYPFYEGDATIGLYILKTVPFGAFWELSEGEELEVSYRITADHHENFHDAMWDSVKRVLTEKRPQADNLLLSPEELVKLRLEALNAYYVEKTSQEDPNMPAGYVLNCHPQDGKQLENIIQYGFTGQNIMNAYHVLRYGYGSGNLEYIRRALRVTDFFADKMQIKDSGIFYNLYNTDKKEMSFWWTGLLLPLAYAEGEELEKLMGPLYEYRRDVIEALKKQKGAYLRCMNEDVTALLRIYMLEKEHGCKHNNWIHAVERYCDFLLRTQEKDGGWRRAYTIDGKAITEPKLWFGGTLYEQKSSTATTVPLLVEMYQYTGEKKYLQAAKRAGYFVKEYIIDRVRFNGGVHDSIYAKGQLIDNESILYPMFAMLSLYEETKEDTFLEGAVRAAHLNASWVCLWRVPLPKNSTLARYHFNSIGMGACDTCGAGYVHPFQLMCVAEMAQIAVCAKDRELLETAELYWKGCNQTVQSSQKDWGYALDGLQEEGYLVSWWAVDDPMFAADTGFGNRLKGEGNKTCFSWIPAVAVKGYWGLLDRFGTTDFTVIKDKYFG